MDSLLRNPVRVYLGFLGLILLGVWSGSRLSMSLFPDINRPEIVVQFAYGSMTSSEFRKSIGNQLAQDIRSIQDSEVEVEMTSVHYSSEQFTLHASFNWGADPELALREVKRVADSVAASLSPEVRRSYRAIINSSSATYMGTFSSSKRTLDQVYLQIAPVLLPKMKSIKGVQKVELINPDAREVEIRLKPDTVMGTGVSISVIESRVQNAVYGQSAGSVQRDGKNWPIRKSSSVEDIDDLRNILIDFSDGTQSRLADLADIEQIPSTESQGLVKTDGRESIILMVTPQAGYNLKKISDEVNQVIEEAMIQVGDEISYSNLVDPSESIKATLRHLAFEIILGSILASLVLYLFIGNFRNVITAAVEIPISMVLALIVMDFCGININLFSLAGLALAAGMNVDASVVVMENIFRYRAKMTGKISPIEYSKMIGKAVSEVRSSVIVSTVASLVVFLPFIFIEGIAQALLGDLMKAVIISHAFSAIVALLLIPTVRFHLASLGSFSDSNDQAPLQVWMIWLEHSYKRFLYKFTRNSSAPIVSLGGVLAFGIFVLPKIIEELPKEIVGKPDSDWILVHFSTENNSTVKQMDSLILPYYNSIKRLVSSEILRSFTVIEEPNSGFVAIRLRSKRDMQGIEEKLKKLLPRLPRLEIAVETWTQSEFQLPRSPDFKIQITGGDQNQRALLAKELKERMEAIGVFEEVRNWPRFIQGEEFLIQPKEEQWMGFMNAGLKQKSDILLEELRTLGQGKWLADLPDQASVSPIILRFPEKYVSSFEDLSAFPIHFENAILPLRSIVQISKQPLEQLLGAENGQELTLVSGYLTPHLSSEVFAQSRLKVLEVLEAIKQKSSSSRKNTVLLSLIDADPDQSHAYKEISWALGLGIGLLFVTMLVHFEGIKDSFLVFLSVPFAILGAFVSLYIFDSSLSLNALLGMTLLSGISVNNSIMMIDLVRKKASIGSWQEADVISAAVVRLRPILITSLTTAIGMLPLACGFGEGGSILKPLGISVVGGLGVSMSLTLLFVPSLLIIFKRRCAVAPNQFELKEFP